MFVLALMAHPFKRANQEIYYCSKNVYYPILAPFFGQIKVILMLSGKLNFSF